MGQFWYVGTQGQLLYSPLLTKEIVHAAQPKMRFVQFCEIKEEWGKRAGETFLIDKYGNIDTAGGILTETAPMPEHGYRVYQSTATLREMGNAIPVSRKYEELAQAGNRRDTVQVLANDKSKTLDTQAEAEWDNCKIRYVATSTSGNAITTDGTATATCTSSLNLFHVKEIIDYMWETLKCDPYDGQNYVAIVSTDAKRGVYDEVEPVMQYTKYPATGEFGRYYDTRFVKTNHGLSNTVGSGSAYGEAYFFGGGAVPPCYMGMAVPTEIIPKELTDYRRSRGLAWYTIRCFKIGWEGDPDNNIVKFDSA